MSLRARLLRCGAGAFLVEVNEPDEDQALAGVLVLEAALRHDAALAGSLVDVVPAARTVLVSWKPGADPESVRIRLRELVDGLSADALPAATRTVTISVEYAGPDLSEVARLTGLSEDEVVAAHTDNPWRVAFGGFAPGFAYLIGGDPRLVVPRRTEPRTRVPAGSVGLAGRFSGVYPRESPGGWQLLGTTDAVLWDSTRFAAGTDSPALLTPGTTVRFVVSS